jgi:iron complex transport system ATP-binding protein
MEKLSFQEASVGYGHRTVLRGLNFSVSAGEVVAVVGPNGVGKSTLVRAASGVIPLQGGQILIGGQPLSSITPEERARLVAVVPQAVRLPGNFTVFSVAQMGRTPYLGWFERESERDREITRDALTRVGLLDEADRQVGEVSGGEQQLTLIARALVQEAPVILLDEPTAHLDLRHQDEVLKLVRRLADEENLAVLLTLHDLNLVARFCDRVALLSDGGLRRLGLPAEVLTPEELAAVYGIAIHVMPHPIHGTPLVLSG